MLIRREFLSGLRGLAVSPLFLHSFAAEATTASNLILVIINLSGGNDGLNTVIPLSQFKQYTTLRRPATPPSANLTLNYSLSQLQNAGTVFDSKFSTPSISASEYAFNPTMTAMRQLYSTGNLAVINGIGLPLAEQASLSHSDASRDWQSGQINSATSAPPGWLGLTLAGHKGIKLGTRAALSGDLPILLTDGVSSPLVASPPIDNFGFSYGSSDNGTALRGTFGKIQALPGSGAAIYGTKALDYAASAVSAVDAIAKAEKFKDYQTPVTWIDWQMREIARLILGGSGLRGYYAEYGSFDTHAQQGLAQPQLIADVSNAMFTFYNYLRANKASANVVIATISDFGRRPGANLDFGTDHGAASTAFVLGDKVTGGVYGTYPSLSKFDPNGNMKVGLDFRNMISDLITAMGGTPTSILGQTYPKIGFI